MEQVIEKTLVDSSQYASLVSSQNAFFQTGKTRSYEFRIQQLVKLYKVISENEKLILEAVKKDLNKSEFEGFFGDVALILHEITYVKKQLRKWMKPSKVQTPITHFGSSCKVYREPYGVNLIISPWNYPFQLTFIPLIGAIAGGNTAIIKPSELTPNSSALIARLIKETFSSEFIACIEGGVEESTALLNERFDHIFFTGSVQVGSIVMQSASKHLTPVTLELGGKSPTIVDSSANIKLAARRIAWGKFFNAGQTCIAPDYIYVHKSIEEKFLSTLKEEIERLFTENPLTYSDYTHVVNDRHFSRLKKLLAGPTVFYGGETDEITLAFEPTILTNVTLDHPVMKEEIFGPILPVLTFRSIDEVINDINSNPKPLALYLFTEKSSVKERIINNIPFGGGCINDTLYHITTPHLPFGGVGHSGHGSYHGIHSFKCFTHEKSVLNQTTKFDLNVRYHTTKGALNIIRKLFK
ncbi:MULTISPECIES: aldehyde dehydrogenase [unclassified Bacillus (in: firmicutes)]|uniref:aldehyde dehydrogenase n=1 Tax=unclassified Bacillus (in: firmicutes) TaxID=185979 RepID=UPI000BF00253|nr:MULTISPECIES: aldehyde dehydrogenase [unclassified Bacillus (in: firmicutes)]PEJ57633.1 aldehyde dehydrogenase family protein [Bacillus sp. AFS002410]PEL08402.1 aldehyde dehydrogenase family protein [Bacillus sp. AFS017336]